MSASAPASTRDAVLSLLMERGEEDAGNLAGTVGISVQAMRRHLRSLADSGLVCASSNSSGKHEDYAISWGLHTFSRGRAMS